MIVATTARTTGRKIIDAKTIDAETIGKVTGHHRSGQVKGTVRETENAPGVEAENEVTIGTNAMVNEDGMVRGDLNGRVTRHT